MHRNYYQRNENQKLILLKTSNSHKVLKLSKEVMHSLITKFYLLKKTMHILITRSPNDKMKQDLYVADEQQRQLIP